MEIHSSFFQIIRKYRNDSSVSDDQFISSIIQSLKKVEEINDCGHGKKYEENEECNVCVTIQGSYWS